ncbi:MAG: hypothetical protein AAF705_11580 [Bacteroidota bacterium]
MHWNEKIDLLKKEFSDEDFSVPLVERKSILRKIENQFISRSEGYYNLNNANPRFCYWWNHIKSPIEANINSDLQSFLKSAINSGEQFWIACELSDGIVIYKARLDAILDLISTGQTWTRIFHIIQLKYRFLISIRIDKVEIEIKASGDRKFKEKLKWVLRQGSC